MTSPAHAASLRVAHAVHRGDRRGEVLARQDLAVARIAAVIETSRTLSPPLREEQAVQLASMLRWT